MSSIHDRRPFVIRPVSRNGWHLGQATDLRATYKMATANYLYIKRLDGADMIGDLPRFSMRKDLVDAGILLPGSAPVWAAEPGLVWHEIDAALMHKPEDLVSAWHTVMTLPQGGTDAEWRRLIELFAQQHLTSKGMICDWAIHALPAPGSGWLVRPHAHLLITACEWKHNRKHALQHPVWCRGEAARRRLESSWLFMAGLSPSPFAWKEW